MLLRPDRDDARIVARHLGHVLTVVGVSMAPPAALAVVGGDHHSASAFLLAAAVAVGSGRSVALRVGATPPLTWTLGMVVAAAGWLLAAAVAALPLLLSGHYAGYGDAVFEAMSALTTTGLTLVQDLDHLAPAMNLWRHLLQALGGAAIVAVALTLFAGAGRPAGTVALGETREHRILPNPRRTAISLAMTLGSFLVAGVAAATAAGVAAGLTPVRAAWHGATLALSAVFTGGMAPTSASAWYYHSPGTEVVLVVLMVAGATSVAVHAALRRGRWRELLDNVEARTMGVTLALLGGGVMVGLAQAGAFESALPLGRRGLFQLVAAHTTTGLTTTPDRLLATDWGLVAPAALVAAMAVGGMAASTGGGIKAYRVGVTVKGVIRDIRRVLLPESAQVVSSYHHGRRFVLDDHAIRTAAGLLLLYVTTYLAGGLVVLFYTSGVDFTEALFESTAAASTGGVSLGILDTDTRAPVKLTFFLEMWLGRLEFLAVLIFAGFLFSFRKDRR